MALPDPALRDQLDLQGLVDQQAQRDPLGMMGQLVPQALQALIQMSLVLQGQLAIWVLLVLLAQLVLQAQLAIWVLRVLTAQQVQLDLLGQTPL